MFLERQVFEAQNKSARSQRERRAARVRQPCSGRVVKRYETEGGNWQTVQWKGLGFPQHKDENDDTDMTPTVLRGPRMLIEWNRIFNPENQNVPTPYPPSVEGSE